MNTHHPKNQESSSSSLCLPSVSSSSQDIQNQSMDSTTVVQLLHQTVTLAQQSVALAQQSVALTNEQNLKKNKDSSCSEVKETNALISSKDDHSVTTTESSNNTTNANNTTGSYNNHINIFLNQNCKDAITFKEFIEGVEFTEEDMFETENHPYVTGISQLFNRKVGKYKLCERPIHCTNQKESKMHIKETSGWKEDENNRTLLQAIDVFTHKIGCQLKDWYMANPDMNNPHSPIHEMFYRFLKNLNQGSTATEVEDNLKKITKQIGKQVYINKKDMSSLTS